MNRKRIVAAGALVLVAVGGWIGWQFVTEPGVLLSRAIRYFRGPVLPAGFASGNGRIEATEYDIATKRAGRIVAVLTAEGDMVQVGQVLARMDTQDLEADLREADLINSMKAAFKLLSSPCSRQRVIAICDRSPRHIARGRVEAQCISTPVSCMSQIPRLCRHQPPPRVHCCASLNTGLVVVDEGILEPHPAKHHSVAAIPTIPRTMDHRSSLG